MAHEVDRHLTALSVQVDQKVKSLPEGENESFLIALLEALASAWNKALPQRTTSSRSLRRHLGGNFYEWAQEPGKTLRLLFHDMNHMFMSESFERFIPTISSEDGSRTFHTYIHEAANAFLEYGSGNSRIDSFTDMATRVIAAQAGERLKKIRGPEWDLKLSHSEYVNSCLDILAKEVRDYQITAGNDAFMAGMVEIFRRLLISWGRTEGTNRLTKVEFAMVKEVSPLLKKAVNALSEKHSETRVDMDAYKEYLDDMTKNIKSVLASSDFRTASARAKQAGLFQPPPKMVASILRWALSFAAFRKRDATEAHHLRLVADLDRLNSSRPVVAFDEAIRDLEVALAQGKSQALAKAYAAFYEAGSTLFGYYLPKGTTRDFSGLPGRLLEVRSFVETAIKMGRDRLDTNRSQAQSLLDKSQAVLDTLTEYQVAGQDFPTDKATMNFEVDLSDWKYGNQDLLQAYRDEYAARVQKTFGGNSYEQFKDSPEFREMFDSAVSSAKNAWKSISVAFVGVKGNAVASWNPAFRLLSLSVPLSADIGQIRESLTQQVEHELRHMGQTILADMHRLSGNVKNKRNFAPGMPSKKIQTPQFDQRNPDDYYLDDVEFYAILADSVEEMKKLFRRVDSEVVSRKDLFLYIVGAAGKVEGVPYGVRPDPFFTSLKKKALGKWKKAVSETYKELFGGSAMPRLASDQGSLEYLHDIRKGWFAIVRGGDVRELIQTLNETAVRRVPPPGEVPKIRGAIRAFSFHWSNAQAKWDVITVREFPHGIDGAEFVVFVGRHGLSPLGKPWTLGHMKEVAQRLNKHPGYASSPDSARRATTVTPEMIARVAAKVLDRYPPQG